MDKFLNKIIHGDAFKVLKEIPDNSIDTIITDSPYGLEFMGKKWDSPKAMARQIARNENMKGAFAYGGTHTRGYAAVDLNLYQEWTRQWAKEALRVAKPGATLLCFGGTRTWHRLACGLEDAGWVIKDVLMWLYGSGFPKGTDIKKSGEKSGKNMEKWVGWKSHSLKPAYEPIIMAMKPNEGSYVKNALKWGVAGLNIDGGRIGNEKIKTHHAPKGTFAGGEQNRGSDTNYYLNQGRFPANVILDEEAAKMLDEQSGINASRFFYVAKASKKERNIGLEGMPLKKAGGMLGRNNGSFDGKITYNQNNHPTVKPLKLMEYLCILTKTPTGGIVLDPFAGSGTTCMAAKKTGRNYIGIELEKEYVEIAKKRISAIPDTLF